MTDVSKFENSSGIPIDLIYGAEELGNAGEFPYLRGVQPDMYRGRHWTMRQYAGFGTAKESNERYRYLLQKGQTGLSVAFDLPTQLGLDPDHARSLGEVGKVGVSIATLADMEILFSGIRLEDVSTSMTINATAGILLAFYLGVARKQGADFKNLRGTVQNDLLKEFSSRGNYIYPPSGSMKLTTDIIEFCKNELPKWNPISISGYHIREAGSTAVQELAFTLGNGIAYVEAALARGLKVDEFASRLSFFFNVHNDFFEEIAKFRAARRLWATIMKERFSAKKPQSMMLRFHAQTGGSTLTAQQPDNNIMRVAYQAMAAVLGGCQSLHTNGFDEALALPTEHSATLALRTQQIIAFETGATSAVDPMGGSAYLEHLTSALEQQAQVYLNDIEKRGGMVSCIEAGYIQSEISASAYSAQRAIEKGDQVVVGVNRFREDSATSAKKPISLLKVSEQVGKDRALEVKAFRNMRNESQTQAALKKLEGMAKEDANTLPGILASVETGATLGEVADVFRKTFGKHKEFTGF